MAIKAGNTEDQNLVDSVYKAKQEHVFKFWEELDKEKRKSLLDQLRTINFSHLQKLIDEHILKQQEEEKIPDLQPLEVIPLPETEEQEASAGKARKAGEELLKQVRVAIFLVAGGQGTRLGYDGPKGCYHISPVKDKSIFQLHAEKIMAMQKRYGTILPWYIMTSRENDKQTRIFFEQHDYFGLKKDNVTFFQQGMIPSLTDEGKLILCDKHKLFMNPDGHGGSILALEKSGALDDMKKRGIEQIFYFQVDNVLINMADPLFIGYHHLENAEMSSKVVAKTRPEEKVGVLGLTDGRMSVIEYSVLPEKLANERTSEGKLKFWAGNIAIHMISVDFVEKMNLDEFSLPYYKAQKAIAYIDDHGKLIEPDAPNALKFEKFVFDALKKTTNSIVLEVRREEEFAPVKNNEGVDSAMTGRQMMMDLHRSWLRDAGKDIPENVAVEISPLFALDREELREKIYKGAEIHEDLYFG